MDIRFSRIHKPLPPKNGGKKPKKEDNGFLRKLIFKIS
jgi:hypothetical protein